MDPMQADQHHLIEDLILQEEELLGQASQLLKEALGSKIVFM